MREKTTDSSPSSDGPTPDIPDFDLLRPIGQGGFGQVWLAANKTTGQLRAVKTISLRRSGVSDPAGREITSITRLQANFRHRHPNLLNILHVGKTATHLFYVMELADDISGKPASANPSYQPATLELQLRSGPLPARQRFGYARQLLKGLASLHEAGMVHRDVKPSNCLFLEGQLKLADFGLLTDANLRISRVGTQRYMPPDGRMDLRADVYAAGLVLYEIITGMPVDRFPHLGTAANELRTDPLLAALLRVALKACQPDPRLRYRNTGEMLAELAASQPETAPRSRSARRRTPWVAAAAAAAIMAGFAFWTTRPLQVHVNFTTHPFEATIFLDGVQQLQSDGTAYKTPCTIENLPAREHRVLFRHPQLADPDAVRIDFAESREIFVELR